MIYVFLCCLLINCAVGSVISTPLGYRPIQCVHTPEESNHIIKPTHNGTWIEYPARNRKQFYPTLPECVENAKYLLKEWNSRHSKDFDLQLSKLKDGWIIDGGYYTPNTMGKFSSIYELPSDNPTNEGQINYYFIGLQDNSDDNLTIIQPVVAYCPQGCGWSYSPGWSGAAWNCCPNGQTWYGTGIEMKNNAIVTNYVESNDQTGYVTVNLTYNDQSSILQFDYDKRQYNWACVTLEAYDYSNCEAFNKTPFMFNNMSLIALDGTNILNPQWQINNAIPNCHGSIKFDQSGLQASIVGTAS